MTAPLIETQRSLESCGVIPYPSVASQTIRPPVPPIDSIDAPMLLAALTGVRALADMNARKLRQRMAGRIGVAGLSG
jgi:hypothetical protein